MALSHQQIQKYGPVVVEMRVIEEELICELFLVILNDRVGMYLFIDTLLNLVTSSIITLPKKFIISPVVCVVLSILL